MDKIAMVKAAEVRGVLACLLDNDLMKVANEEEFEAVAEIVAENLGDDYTLEDVLDTTAEVIETAEALENMSDEELAALEAEAGEVVDEGEGEIVELEVKEASEKDDVDPVELMNQYGELLMAKEAGEITDAYFEKKAASIQGILQALKGGAAKAYTGDIAAGARAAKGSVGSKAKDIGSYLKGGFTADKLRKAKGMSKAKGSYAVNIKKIPLEDTANRSRLRSQFKGRVGTKADRAALLRKGLLQSGAAYGGATGLAGGAAYGGSRLAGRGE
jgi:hypothetical protein